MAKDTIPILPLPSGRWAEIHDDTVKIVNAPDGRKEVGVISMQDVLFIAADFIRSAKEKALRVSTTEQILGIGGQP